MSRTTPAIERNREPIGDQLEALLTERASVLEIASGPGAHAAYFAQRFPRIQWQPSEVDDARLADIRKWCDSVALENLRAPLAIDATASPWPDLRVDLILSINMIHIAPFPDATEGLFRGARQVAQPGAAVALYGPFFRKEVATAPSNIDFDATLRKRIPGAGIRQLESVVDVARAHGFEHDATVEMPANNCFVVFSSR